MFGKSQNTTIDLSPHTYNELHKLFAKYFAKKAPKAAAAHRRSLAEEADGVFQAHKRPTIYDYDGDDPYHGVAVDMPPPNDTPPQQLLVERGGVESAGGGDPNLDTLAMANH